MYLIFIIIFLVLIIEIYNIAKDFSFKFEHKQNKETNIDEKFEEYIANKSFEKKFNSGKIYTDDNYNLFIIMSKEFLLMKKDEIYTINEPFILKYININEGDIKYYYR